MLSIKVFFVLAIISLAILVPGKNGKMYLVEVESEKESSNSLPGSISKFNARPRMQSKAQLTPPPDLVAAVKEWREKRHPACVDKDGIMHREGEIFFPNDEKNDEIDKCKVCSCHYGKPHCSPYSEELKNFANVSDKIKTNKDLFNCKKEWPGCGWMFWTVEDDEDLSYVPEHSEFLETFRISKCDSCSCDDHHGYNCTKNVKDACECGAVKEGETYHPKRRDCNYCVCKAFVNKISQNFRNIWR